MQKFKYFAYKSYILLGKFGIQHIEHIENKNERDFAPWSQVHNLATCNLASWQFGKLAIWQFGNLARNAELTFNFGNFQNWELPILATFNFGNFQFNVKTVIYGRNI